MGSNITMGEEGTLVSISEADGNLIIHEFGQTSGTDLGREVEEELRKAGLPCKRAYPALPQISQDKLTGFRQHMALSKMRIASGFNADYTLDLSKFLEIS